jgi:hypothetical protein
MQPLTGDFTEEKIDREVKYGDDILVFHKKQGQMPIRFISVGQEYLFFIDIDETQNLYSVMDGKIHLKDIDRIEGIKRDIERIREPIRRNEDHSTVNMAVAQFLFGLLIIPLLILLAG